METFQINLNKHFKSGWGISLGTLICLGTPRTLAFIYRNQSYSDSILVGILTFVVFVLPTIIIHVNYYLVNKGDILSYSSQQKEFTIFHKGISTTFNIEDINHVEQSISYNQAAKRSSVVPWDGYNHSVIHLKNGDIFTITSLLVPDLDLPIEKEKIVVKRNFYRLAKIRSFPQLKDGQVKF